jgi:hypothetical protein
MLPITAVKGKNFNDKNEGKKYQDQQRDFIIDLLKNLLYSQE